jgi:hypothetical protein
LTTQAPLFAVDIHDPLVTQPDTKLMEHACSENNKYIVPK